MRTFITGAVVALGLAFAAPAAAQDSRAELAREVVALMDIEATLVEMMDTLSPIVASSAAQDLQLSPSEVGRFTEILQEEFRKETPAMVERMAEVYSETVEEADLRNIRDFLRTPSGQAMIANQGMLQSAMEREGRDFGMRVALSALGRLMTERRDNSPS